MITYLFKKKIEQEVKEHSKKLIVYAGFALVGVGAYCVYKSIKKSKMEYEEDEIRYITSSNYDEEAYTQLFDEAIQEEDESISQNKELEKKIDEFNSRRINCENCPHVSQEEMQDFLDKTDNGKKDVQINIDDYKEEEYENYEYYDGNLINKQ